MATLSEAATQALAWPRTVAPGVVPREIVSACCELACKAGDLWSDVDASAVVSETIGPLWGGAPPVSRTRHQRIMSPLL